MTKALGIFHAVHTTDHTALEHDGMPYYELNVLKTNGPEELIEICFDEDDDDWMLAVRGDLTTFTN